MISCGRWAPQAFTDADLLFFSDDEHELHLSFLSTFSLSAAPVIYIRDGNFVGKSSHNQQ